MLILGQAVFVLIFRAFLKICPPPRGKSLMSLEKPSSDRVDLSEAKNVDVVQKIILLCGKLFFKLVFEFFWHVCFGKNLIGKHSIGSIVFIVILVFCF